MVLEGLKRLPAIPVGHHHIQGDDLRLELQCQAQGFLAVLCSHHLIAMAIQIPPEETDNILIVIHHQHGPHIGYGQDDVDSPFVPQELHLPSLALHQPLCDNQAARLFPLSLSAPVGGNPFSDHLHDHLASRLSRRQRHHALWRCPFQPLGEPIEQNLT